MVWFGSVFKCGAGLLRFGGVIKCGDVWCSVVRCSVVWRWKADRRLSRLQTPARLTKADLKVFRRHCSARSNKLSLKQFVCCQVSKISESALFEVDARQGLCKLSWNYNILKYACIISHYNDQFCWHDLCEQRTCAALALREFPKIRGGCSAGSRQHRSRA